LQQAEDLKNDDAFGEDSSLYTDVMNQIADVEQAMQQGLITEREYKLALAEAPYQQSMKNYQNVLEAN